MNYALTIREHNIQAHIDIEDEIKRKQNGLFTFIIRVNNGNIVDSVIMENIDAGKYLALKSITFEEYSIAHNYRTGSAGNPVRRDNIQHPVTQWNSTINNTKYSKEPKAKV